MDKTKNTGPKTTYRKNLVIDGKAVKTSDSLDGGFRSVRSKPKGAPIHDRHGNTYKDVEAASVGKRDRVEYKPASSFDRLMRGKNAGPRVVKNKRGIRSGK